MGGGLFLVLTVFSLFGSIKTMTADPATVNPQNQYGGGALAGLIQCVVCLSCCGLLPVFIYGSVVVYGAEAKTQCSTKFALQYSVGIWLTGLCWGWKCCLEHVFEGICTAVFGESLASIQ